MANIEVSPEQKPAFFSRKQGYLYNSAIDFICLGGGSLPILIFLLMLPSEEYKVSALITVIMLSHFINNPHFMNSYQIFYSSFSQKISLENIKSGLGLRYIFAGIIVPALIVSFFSYATTIGDPVLLGKSINAMLFFVGWHYVKQGYGILIVESVMKKAFFDNTEKYILRYNGIAAWLFSWVLANDEVASSDLYSLSFYTFDTPDWAFNLVAAIAAAMGAAAAGVLLRKKFLQGRSLPLNGILAYATSIYVWMFVSQIDVLMLIVVPVFHSLQYLAVVWRYKLNETEAVYEPKGIVMFNGLLNLSRPRFEFCKFVFIGIVLGACAFTVVPTLLDYYIQYNEELYGPTLFILLSTVFINIHHYFLDNVMWRKENPEIKKHLFTPPSS